MKYSRLLFLWLLPIMAVAAPPSAEFSRDKDLLLFQFDSKTDVDDLHTIAAIATLIHHIDLKTTSYHAVAGAYGTQGGLYVPSPELFALAFDQNWSDAHNDHDGALEQVSTRVTQALTRSGDVWVIEAGQSDFTAAWLKHIKAAQPTLNTGERIHVIQHSDWNERSATPGKLSYVKAHTDYQKIPDGNAVGNGTPGFKSSSSAHWAQAIGEPTTGRYWQLAKKLGERYNGTDERYNNPAIAEGGIDFSDTVEACWVLDCGDLHDVEAFFQRYSEKTDSQ